MSEAVHTSPLLDHSGLPRFSEITPDQVVPGITYLLNRLETELDAFEESVKPSWEGLVEPLERLCEPLGRAWGTIGHLMGVQNSEAIREAHSEMQPRVVQVMTRIGQSQAIYRAAKAMRESETWATLDPTQHRIMEKLIRDAELSGIGLDDTSRERFNKIQAELAELSTAFSNAVLDATKAFKLDLTDRNEVLGLPPSLLELAAQASGDENATTENGPWRITLDAPSFAPFLQHSRRRDLREQAYRAYISRASTGEFDNTPRIERILELRAEKAKLLGFEDFAAMSLAKKMANSVAEIDELLEQLLSRSLESAEQDLEDVRAFAKQQGAEEADSLCNWDIAFWAERLREDRYDFNDETIRPYFPLPKVLTGLFDLAERLFGIKIEAATGEAPRWHEDVQYFRIANESGAPIAAFYLDPFSRPAEKRGGAWMDDCVGRSRLFAPAGAEVRLPVAYLVCNGTPPVGDKPSLMSFREVETLFHEFGHGLQHMLTTIDYESAAGISGVEWDAVELPSQFMENWCYHRPTLLGFSGHWETGEPLPVELFEKISAARTFRSASGMLRQLYFSMTDLALHHKYDPEHDGSAFEVQRRIAEKATVLAPLPEDRFLCAFSHIFSGGYAAGYYSYKWAEVLSADAFSAFEDAGLDDEEKVKETGHRFRDTVLALGGSQHPMKIFESFRGRGPTPDALLRHAGLKA